MNGTRQPRSAAAGGLAVTAIVVLDLLALSALILYADLKAGAIRPPSRRVSRPPEARATDVTARFGPEGLRLAGRTVTLRRFETRLRRLVELDSDQGVLLVVADGAPSAGLRKVIAACRAAGIRRVVLSSEEREP